MRRLEKLFREKVNILNIYFTAGFPKLKDTLPILQSLQKSKVDLVEIGLPYSDPLSDGTTIQESSYTALKNGFQLNFLFEELKNFRDKIHIPVIFMGYFNQILQYGVEKFCEQCKKIQIDSVIIPDLPLVEYKKNYQFIFEKYNLFFHFLITPKTNEKKIFEIDSISKNFIYVVSRNSLTGIEKNFDQIQVSYFDKLKSLKLKNPFLIGFGIHNKETFDLACKYSSGGIIGSMFIKFLKEKGTDCKSIQNFINSIKPEI